MIAEKRKLFFSFFDWLLCAGCVLCLTVPFASFQLAHQRLFVVDYMSCSVSVAYKRCLSCLYRCCHPVYIHCILHNVSYGLTTYRGTEVVESTVRQHIGACFSALEQRVLSTLSEASQRLSSSPAASPAPSQDTSTQDKPLLQASRLFLLCLQKF